MTQTLSSELRCLLPHPSDHPVRVRERLARGPLDVPEVLPRARVAAEDGVEGAGLAGLEQLQLGELCARKASRSIT